MTTDLHPSIIQRVSHTRWIPRFITYPQPERPHYTDERTRQAYIRQSQQTQHGKVAEYVPNPD